MHDIITNKTIAKSDSVAGHVHASLEPTAMKNIDVLSQNLLTAHDSFTVAERALEFLLATFGLEGGALLAQQGSYFQPFASCGQLSKTIVLGLPITTTWLEPCYKYGQPLSLDQDSCPNEKRRTLHSTTTFMVYPLGETLPTRFILLLARSKQRQWSHLEKESLTSLSRILSLSLRFAESQTRLKTLLTLQRHSLTESEDKLLHDILLAAVQTVPGAEAGSLLLRRGKKFHFRATVGYDLKALEPFKFKDEAMRFWQHPELLSWDSSEPRIFTKKDDAQKQMPC